MHAFVGLLVDQLGDAGAALFLVGCLFLFAVIAFAALEALLPFLLSKRGGR